MEHEAVFWVVVALAVALAIAVGLAVALLPSRAGADDEARPA